MLWLIMPYTNAFLESENLQAKWKTNQKQAKQNWQFLLYIWKSKILPNSMDSSLLLSISIKSADLSSHDKFFCSC